MKTELGLIVARGQGGFLCPPGHPEHSFCVETDLRRSRKNRGSMSLSYAVNCEYLDASTRAAAQSKLDEWQVNKPPLSDASVREWTLQVLGYFRGCYRNPDKSGAEQWNVSNLIIDKRDPLANPADHAGVRMIRKYYPEFTPTEEDFAQAFWGKRPEGAMAIKYRVNWDNGASACGTFPYVFDTFEEADEYGTEWADESNIRDFGCTAPARGYSYDVIETDEPTDEEKDAHEGAEHQRMRTRES